MLDVRGIELRKVGGPEVPEIREPAVDLVRLNPDVGDEDAHSLLAFAVRGPAMISTSPTCLSSIASRIRHAIGTPANSNSRSMAN